MNPWYLFIQGIGFIGTILFFLSFQFRENKKLYTMQLCSYIFYTIHLFLLGATTGAFSYILNGIRSLFLSSKWKFANRWEMCAVLCLLQCAVLYFTWDGWISLLPIAANIASTIGGYTHNARKIRTTMFFINSPLWIVYNIIVGSWAGVLDEAVSEISIIISVIRFGWRALDKEE